jgi:hypothetical protein
MPQPNKLVRERARKMMKLRAMSLEYATHTSLTPTERKAAKRKRAEQFRPKESKYKTYLRSAEWRIFRMNTLAQRGSACEVCKAYTKHPQIHHLTYERLGKELPTDVVVTCDDCHRAYHGIPSAAKEIKAVKKAKRQRLERKKVERSQGRTGDHMPALAGMVGPKNEARSQHLSGNAIQSGIIRANGVVRDR